MRWNPETYLAFADERGRPFADLVQRIPGEPRTIVDLGCGPGQLTRILRERWPTARITGVDSSEEMIDKAVRENTDPMTTYVRADVTGWTPEDEQDLVVSNAMFQWVDNQFDLITRLTEIAGTIAIQVPNNFGAPSHALMREVAGRAPYVGYLDGLKFRAGVGAEAYLDLFAGLGWSVDAWETTYQHILQGDDAVFHWVSGTGARPVLQALPDDIRPGFEADYKAALREAYPQRSWGTVLPFARVFVVAARVAFPLRAALVGGAP